MLILQTRFILSLTKFNRPFSYQQKKNRELGEKRETRLLPKSHYSYRNVFYAVKMHNLSGNSNVRELNWKKLVDKKIIKHCFIEWSNMI